jgi:hypothetical protein
VFSGRRGDGDVAEADLLADLNLADLGKAP